MKTYAKQIVLVMGIAGCQQATPPAAEIAKTTPVTVESIDNTHAAQKVVAADDDETKQSDEEVTSRVREKIAHKKLSTSTQEIIIVTRAGKITLQGVVKTAEEKQQIEDIARAVAGTQNVWNQLEVE